MTTGSDPLSSISYVRLSAAGILNRRGGTHEKEREGPTLWELRRTSLKQKKEKKSAHDQVTELTEVRIF